MNGAAVEIDSPRAARDLGIRIIYQELNLVPHLSVAENIFLGELPSRFGGLVDWAALTERDRRAADRSRDDARSARAGRRLGIAQRQMVEIAKALARPATRASWSWTSRPRR